MLNISRPVDNTIWSGVRFHTVHHPAVTILDTDGKVARWNTNINSSEIQYAFSKTHIPPGHEVYIRGLTPPDVPTDDDDNDVVHGYFTFIDRDPVELEEDQIYGRTNVPATSNEDEEQARSRNILYTSDEDKMEIILTPGTIYKLWVEATYEDHMNWEVVDLDSPADEMPTIGGFLSVPRLDFDLYDNYWLMMRADGKIDIEFLDAIDVEHVLKRAKHNVSPGPPITNRQKLKSVPCRGLREARSSVSNSQLRGQNCMGIMTAKCLRVTK